jgi:glucosyl-3-phosphoglycerate synthase
LPRRAAGDHSGTGVSALSIADCDRARSGDQDEYQHALSFFSDLPQHHRVLWNDGPRLKAIDARLQEAGLAPRSWARVATFGTAWATYLATGRAEAIALHDCDILTYERSLLARLIYPVAHPIFGYEFCKGYYPRVSDNKINGGFAGCWSRR